MTKPNYKYWVDHYCDMLDKYKNSPNPKFFWQKRLRKSLELAYMNEEITLRDKNNLLNSYGCYW